MSKKAWYIIGAIVVIGILVWGYKTKGWFGGTVASTTTTGTTTGGK